MQEKSKEGFMELGNSDSNSAESDYRLPSIIEDLLIKKQNMTNKEKSSVKINKANERDLEKVDRVDLNHVSQDKLILSNNIQVSENRNANENFSLENRQGMDKTESNRAKSQKMRSAVSDKIIGKNRTNDIYIHDDYHKVENSINDKSISVSNNQLNEEDYIDNSQNLIKVEKLNEKNLNYFSSRGLEKSLNSYQFNLHNIENIDRFSDRKQPNKKVI